MSLVESAGSTRRRALTLAAAVILPVAAGFAWIRLAPRSTPAGQPPLAIIGSNVEALSPLRDAVNAAADRDRLLLLLSPT